MSKKQIEGVQFQPNRQTNSCNVKKESLRDTVIYMTAVSRVDKMF